MKKEIENTRDWKSKLKKEIKNDKYNKMQGTQKQ
jgi:hypothetical protein